MSVTPTQSVTDIVRTHPAAVGVFEALGIDYCCGGANSLAEACRRVNVPVHSVVADLECALSTPPPEDDSRWLSAPLAELADVIVFRHHSFVRRELPRLSALAAKVHDRHGATHPELASIRDLLDVLSAELFPHMLKEERVLFPLIKQLDASPHAPSMPLLAPIRHMMDDHDDAGELLRKIRALASGFEPPPEACASYNALYSGLEAFEKDMHHHIHLENNILFPRALESERRS